jgi:rubrerythrin
MKAVKTKTPSGRGKPRKARSPGGRARGPFQSTASRGEESEFLARAWAIEVEAVERYSMLADTMEAHNNAEVAELFRKLARIEQLHADKIAEQNRSRLPQQALSEGKQHWDEGEREESVDPGELHYRMQPYHALQLALAGEHRARRFFEKVARSARSAAVRATAQEMAADEVEHVRLIEDWMSRTAKPDEDWAYDPDPPASGD